MASTSGFLRDFVMPDPYSGYPSLDDARARVDRASEHIARLQTEISTILQNHTQWQIRTVEKAGGQFVESGDLYFPAIINILIGEIIYNLRAALDYLVYELGILDSGKAQERCQFPIESTPKGWTKHEASWLMGLSDVHKAAIESLQPYNGCKWTELLREISNIDKHRRLHIASGWYHANVGRGIAGEPHTVRPDAIIGAMEVEGQVAAFVQFEDGTPVIEALEVIQLHVANVLIRFDRDFQ